MGVQGEGSRQEQYEAGLPVNSMEQIEDGELPTERDNEGFDETGSEHLIKEAFVKSGMIYARGTFDFFE